MYLRHLFAYEEALRRLTPDAFVLDIGCGEGYGTDRLAHTVRAAGMDVDGPTIAAAARSYGRPRCRYVLYDGARIPFLTGGFDAAVTFQVIEHVSDARAFLAEAARVIRPGGLLILTTPNRLLRLDPGQRPWNRYHVDEYAPGDLRDLLARHFEAVDMLGICGDPEAQAHEMERLAWVRRTAARDRLGLRRWLPEWIRQRLLARLRGAAARTDTPDVASWTTGRYMLTSDAAQGLDLFAVCRTRGA
jgi:SAM-dependent methyltransferase